MAITSIKSLAHSFGLIFRSRPYMSLFVANMCSSLLYAMIMPVFPLWLSTYHANSLSVVFFVLSILGVGNAILDLGVGYLTDRVGHRKTIIMMAHLLSAMRCLAFCLSPPLWIVTFVSFLTQVSTSGPLYSILSICIEDDKNDGQRGLITSTVRTSTSLGFIAGPAAGMALLDKLSFHQFFLLIAILYSLLLLFVAIFLPSRNSSTQVLDSSVNSGQMGRTRSIFISVCLLFIVMVLLLSGNMVSSGLLTLFIKSQFQHRYHQIISLVLGVGPIAEVVFFPLVGYLTDRFGTVKLLIVGGVAEIVYFIFLSKTTSFLVLLCVQVFGAFYIAILFTCLLLYAQKLLVGRIGLASSLFDSAISISIVFGDSILGVFLLKHGLRTGFLALASLSFVGTLVLIIWSLSNRRVASITDSQRASY